jgi:cellulose 1,4-beta-cellobiosidase
VSNLELSSCEPARRSWRQNVPLGLKSLDLPNVITYMDAAHGGWLGWRDIQRAGAKEIANTWKSAGELKQFRGIAVNVASYNSWSVVSSDEQECRSALTRVQEYVTR